jgi:SAM-dependent MidA family methyltransferase
MLEQIIIDRIKGEGPIPFHDFMEMALYYPELGYYTSDKNKIGTDGDFLTSSNYTSVFGELLAVQLEEMDNNINGEKFTVVEYGAGTGLFCNDILKQFEKSPRLFGRLSYCIIEKSPSLIKKQKELLGEKVNWYNSIHEIGPFEGCIISNELIDNFSVHQVTMENNLMEIYVGYDDGFTEICKPASAELINYLAELDISLPRGYRAEINLEALEWTANISAAIKKGYVITIDYGYPANQLYSASHYEGTLVCYHNHSINYSPYKHIGEQDITSHVNFSALNHWGAKHGLELNGFTSQAFFLMSLGLREQFPTNGQQYNTHQFLKRFLLDMGKKFKVLVLQKGIPKQPLKGMRFTEKLY